MPAITISKLSKQYQENGLTPTTLIESLWPKLEKADPAIWIYRISKESLLDRAKKLESSSSEELPLYGIPFAVKDNMDVAGCPTSAGCPDFTYHAKTNAHVVELLLSAGAILIGKTNMDQFATGLVGTRSPYGVPGNIFNQDFIAGGSSSGSAVAVARGLVSFSLGTDTAGSGRVPASFNNLLGYKPTRGKLSNRGIIPACRTLDCVSVFGLQVWDIEKVLHVLDEWDPLDPFSKEGEEKIPRTFSDSQKVALLQEDQLEFFGDSNARKAYEKSVRVLTESGLHPVPVDLSPFLEAAELLYAGPWVAERHLATSPLIMESPQSLLPETLKIIRGGSELSARDAFQAQYKLAELRRQADKIWKNFDFLALPTTATIYTQEAISKNPIELNSNLGRYTNFMNLLDLCGCAVPTAFREDGLPSGLTLFAPAFHDHEVLRWAGEIHRTAQTGAGLELEFEPESYYQAEEMERIDLFVCGSHMSGLPLNKQLTELGAEFLREVKTASYYRMFILPPTESLPLRPGLVRCAEETVSLPGELWRMPLKNFGAFMLKIRFPLGISQVDLQNGEMEYGFCCDPSGMGNCTEITQRGGWRSYLAGNPIDNPISPKGK